MKYPKNILALLILSPIIHGGEMNSWECSSFEDAKIIGEDGDYLGRLGPGYKSDSIFNSSSSYSSTYSSDSIFNTSSKYGNTYSSSSVFNDGASSPPIILSDDGRVLGKLSIGPGYQADRFDPYDIKYTCDWD
ncbi:hypothetical protein OAC45_03990 [Gammaproteobacteria bacterium]|nr:hypothetical protein [Gammaproteobacteria bacterium]